MRFTRGEVFHTGATPACYDGSVEWMRQQRRSTQGRGDDHDLRGRYHDAEALRTEAARLL